MNDQELQELGKYEINEEIGRGGFGTVYKAIDTTSERMVALKVLDPWLLREPGAVERIQREANIAQRLDHPNIVKVLDVGEADGTHYIAMEYLEGQSLKALIQKEGALSTDRLLRIMEQVADALDYIHGLGLLHCDVKPSNIIVGEDDKATLTDFGLAMVSGLSGFTTGKALLGTLPYMSPEQVAGQEPDHRSDVYSLAVTAYEMCTGRLPFSGDNPAAIIKGITLDQPPAPSQTNPSVSEGIEDAILKSLAKDKRERHQSAGALAENLREAGRPGYMVKAKPKPKKPKEPEPPRRRNWTAMLVGLLLVVCIGSAVVGVLVLPGLLPASIPSQATEALTPTPILTPEGLVTPQHTPSATAASTPEASPTATPMSSPTPTAIPSSTPPTEPSPTESPTLLPPMPSHPPGVHLLGQPFEQDAVELTLVRLEIRTESDYEDAAARVWFRFFNKTGQDLMVEIDWSNIHMEDDLGNLYVDWAGAETTSSWVDSGESYDFNRYYTRRAGERSRLPSGAAYVQIVVDEFSRLKDALWHFDINPMLAPIAAPPPGTAKGVGQTWEQGELALTLENIEIRADSDYQDSAARAWFVLDNRGGERKLVEIDFGYFYILDSFGRRFSDWEGGGVVEYWVDPGDSLEFNRYYTEMARQRSRVTRGAEFVLLAVEKLGPIQLVQWQFDIVR